MVIYNLQKDFLTKSNWKIVKILYDCDISSWLSFLWAWVWGIKFLGSKVLATRTVINSNLNN